MIIENHSMDRIYKISFQIYRIILILTLPIFLISKFLVATAGHNSQMKIDDYFLLGFVTLVPTLLTILIKTDKTKISLRKTIRFVIIGLISANIAFFFYGLYDFRLLYQDQNFGTGDTIIVAIIIFLIKFNGVGRISKKQNIKLLMPTASSKIRAFFPRTSPTPLERVFLLVFFKFLNSITDN